jgi:hypothetical protein
MPNSGGRVSQGARWQAILQFVVIFDGGAGILYLTPNLGVATRLEAARKPRRKGGCPQNSKTMPAHRARAGVFTWKSYWRMDGMATAGCSKG